MKSEKRRVIKDTIIAVKCRCYPYWITMHINLCQWSFWWKLGCANWLGPCPHWLKGVVNFLEFFLFLFLCVFFIFYLITGHDRVCVWWLFWMLTKVLFLTDFGFTVVGNGGIQTRKYLSSNSKATCIEELWLLTLCMWTEWFRLFSHKYKNQFLFCGSSVFHSLGPVW